MAIQRTSTFILWKQKTWLPRETLPLLTYVVSSVTLLGVTVWLPRSGPAETILSGGEFVMTDVWSGKEEEDGGSGKAAKGDAPGHMKIVSFRVKATRRVVGWGWCDETCDSLWDQSNVNLERGQKNKKWCLRGKVLRGMYFTRVYHQEVPAFFLSVNSMKFGIHAISK